MPADSAGAAKATVCGVEGELECKCCSPLSELERMRIRTRAHPAICVRTVAYAFAQSKHTLTAGTFAGGTGGEPMKQAEATATLSSAAAAAAAAQSIEATDGTFANTEANTSVEADASLRLHSPAVSADPSAAATQGIALKLGSPVPSNCAGCVGLSCGNEDEGGLIESQAPTSLAGGPFAGSTPTDGAVGAKDSDVPVSHGASCVAGGDGGHAMETSDEAVLSSCNVVGGTSEGRRDVEGVVEVGTRGGEIDDSCFKSAASQKQQQQQQQQQQRDEAPDVGWSAELSQEGVDGPWEAQVCWLSSTAKAWSTQSCSLLEECR